MTFSSPLGPLHSAESLSRTEGILLMSKEKQILLYVPALTLSLVMDYGEYRISSWNPSEHHLTSVPIRPWI